MGITTTLTLYNLNLRWEKFSYGPRWLHPSIRTVRRSTHVSPPIFSLKSAKNRSRLIETSENISTDELDLSYLDCSYVMSETLVSTLSYIAGCIVRPLYLANDCSVCCTAMISKDETKGHLSLIALRDNGGLIYPSDDIVKIVQVCEKYFKYHIRGKYAMIASKNLQIRMEIAIIAELSTTRPGQILFEDLLQHDVNEHSPLEDYHSTQIMKSVVRRFIKMRLLRYGQEITQDLQMKKKSLGKRQQLNKLTLFTGV